MKILIAGDFAPVYHRLKAKIINASYSDVLGEVHPIVSETDYSIVNFESPIADPATDSPIKKNGPNISTPPNALDALKWCGFKMITLANNHIFDYGEAGVINTLDYAKKTGIQTIGAGINLADASRIKYISIKDKKVALINCCENEFSIATETTAGANPINPIKQFYDIQTARSNADRVIVIVHGGHEYCQLPSIRMQDTYRFYIDAGADAVVNHHQHCYSGFEVYNGKPIFYGLGNFCFDKSNPYKLDLWTEGYMVILDFSTNDTKFELLPYTQCNETPSVVLSKDKAAFLSRIEELNITIQNRNQLKAAIEDYYASCSSTALEIFEPYRGRYLKSAFSRGLLPSFLKGSKILEVLNSIKCESHLDKLKYAIEHLNQQKR